MPRTFASSRTAANESGVVADLWPAGIAPPGTTRPIGLDEPTANLLNADVPLLEEHLEGVAEEGRLFSASPTFITRYFGHSP